VILDDGIKTIQNEVYLFSLKKRTSCFFLKIQKNVVFFRSPKKPGGLFFLFKSRVFLNPADKP